ncbi:hypothetical protein [Haloferax sp. DFSO60]|uniref:hypothetical protein n=1 Tax=Haloferax sp. DFSO60 TaxID=3388652 RepID=UPI00397BF3A4
MSNNFADADESVKQRKFYGEPQHEDADVDDREMFAAASEESEFEEEDERALYCLMPHFRPDARNYAHSGSSNNHASVA